MNLHPPQTGKSPIGPATTQIRGFRGMPKPEEVFPEKQKTPEEIKNSTLTKNPENVSLVQEEAKNQPSSSGFVPQESVTPQQSHSQSSQSVQTSPQDLSQQQELVEQTQFHTELRQKPVESIKITHPEEKVIPQTPQVISSTEQQSTPQQQILTSDVPHSAAAYASHISEAPEQIQEKKARPIVRTFKNDATSYIKNQNITATQIALAEQRRQQERGFSEVIEQPTSKKIWIILGIILLILMSIAAFVFVVFKPELPFLSNFQKDPVVIPQTKLSSLTGSQDVEYVELDSSLSFGEIDQFFDRLLRKENGAYLFVEETVAGGKEFIFPSTFFDYTRMYDLQDIAFIFKNIEYGIREESPYLLMETTDFPKAYPRIFAWEDRMVEHVEPLFPTLRERQVVVQVPIEEPQVEALLGVSGESESVEGEISGMNETQEDISSESEELQEMNIESGSLEQEEPVLVEKVITQTVNYRNLPFRGALLKNQNLRVILDEEGNPLLYHTFFLDRYVLISQDLEVIPYINDMLKKKASLQ